MIRLTLILAIAIFAVLVLVPREDDRTQPAPAETTTASALQPDTRADATSGETGALRETADGRMVLTTTTGEQLTIDLVVEPSDVSPTGADDDVPTQETAAAAAIPEATAQTANADDATGPRLRVTGDRVNFRAGPSTDDAILATLELGTEVVLLERVADGWAHLRVTATGLTGYMSGDFLEPAN